MAELATTGGLRTVTNIVPNNTTSVAVKATAGQLYSISVFNNSATVAYIKLYDATQAATSAGAGTPVWRGMIPANGGFVHTFPGGLTFGNAITYCITLGIADNDTTAPGATTYLVNFGYY